MISRIESLIARCMLLSPRGSGGRTKPLTLRKAAKWLGKGDSQDAAEWLAKSIEDGSYRAEVHAAAGQEGDE